jgi:YD repeat-containing protein
VEGEAEPGQRTTSTGTTLSTFVYDGDGNRVRATQNGVTTLCIGT